MLRYSKLSLNYIEKEEERLKSLVVSDNGVMILLPPDAHCAACGCHLTAPAQTQLQFPFVPWLNEPGHFLIRFPNSPVIHESVSEPWVVTCGENCFMAGLEKQMLRYSLERRTLVKFLSSSEQCHGCLRYSLKTHRCSECRSVRYCSNSCLARDWPNHREPCQILRQSQTSVLGNKQRNKSQATSQALLSKLDPYLDPFWDNDVNSNSCTKPDRSIQHFLKLTVDLKIKK